MKAKYALLSQLRKSLLLLEHKRDMLPKYVNQSEAWAGKNHYSLDMLPGLEFQIDEMNAAIQGIEAWKKENLKQKK